MNDASSFPPILVERSGADYVRVTVPSTNRVRSLYRRMAIGRFLGMLTLGGLFAVFALSNWRNLTADMCGGTGTIIFLGMAAYAISHPSSHMPFTDHETVIEFHDRVFTVRVGGTDAVREYPSNEVLGFRGKRCDFSRCGLIEMRIRRERRVRRGIVAVYADSKTTAEAITALNRVLTQSKT